MGPLLEVINKVFEALLVDVFKLLGFYFRVRWRRVTLMGHAWGRVREMAARRSRRAGGSSLSESHAK